MTMVTIAASARASVPARTTTEASTVGDAPDTTRSEQSFFKKHRGALIGAGVGAAALVGAGLLALNPGARRFALPVLGAGLAGAVLAGCATPTDKVPQQPPTGPATPDARGRIDAGTAGPWRLAPPSPDNPALASLITETITPSSGVRGITGERLGTQDVLLKLPVQEFVERWSASGTTHGSSSDSSSGEVTERSLGTAIERARRETSSSVYSTSSYSELISGTGAGTGVIYGFEETPQGQSLGRPLGTRSYPDVETAVGTIDAVADAGGARIGSYALVRTDDGLRPFKVDHEFGGVNQYDDLLVRRDDVEAIVTSGNVYVPSQAVSAVDEAGGNDAATIFSYRSSVDAVGSLGPIVEIPTVAPKRTIPAPDIGSARIGAMTVQSRFESDFYTGDWQDTKVDINLELTEAGGIAPGYASLADALQGVRATAADATASILGGAYVVAKVDDGYYVAPYDRFDVPELDEPGTGTRITNVRANVDIDELHIVKAPGYGDTRGLRVLDASELVRGSSELR